MMKRRKRRRETDKNKKGKFRTAISLCAWFRLYSIEPKCTCICWMMAMPSSCSFPLFFAPFILLLLLLSQLAILFPLISRSLVLLCECEQKKLIPLTANHIFLRALWSQEYIAHKLYHSNMTQILILHGLFFLFFPIHARRAYNSVRIRQFFRRKKLFTEI